ncbi:MAG: response regulator [Candidatus Protistobacter heckmanni]|nr:response regulator [Candidatus Protistobacter heckmanni]
MINGEGEYCSTREAASMLGVSLRTAQLWVENGVLRAWKTAGGHRRILRQSVNHILEERKNILNTHSTDDRSMKVVIVEGDPDLLKLLGMTISGLNLGIEIETEQNGFEGLVLVGQFQPDLLIADLNMPGMDGFRMIRSLYGSTEYRPRRIVVATALSPADIQDRGGLPEGVTVFQKPIPFSELEVLVREEHARYIALQASEAPGA